MINWEEHEKYRDEDGLTLEKIGEYINEWNDLLPSFQSFLARWMYEELELNAQSFDMLGL